MQIKVTIGISPTLGIRGVIADEIIEAGETIEVCPVIVLPSKEAGHIEMTHLDDYVYAWNQESDCLVLGRCGLVNHSYQPNAEYVRDLPDKTMVYIAIKNISPGEEVTVNYNGNPADQTQLDKQYVTPNLKYNPGTKN
jgi:uncharacterized protein